MTRVAESYGYLTRMDRSMRVLRVQTCFCAWLRSLHAGTRRQLRRDYNMLAYCCWRKFERRRLLRQAMMGWLTAFVCRYPPPPGLSSPHVNSCDPHF